MYRVQKKKRGGVFFWVTLLCTAAILTGVGFGGFHITDELKNIQGTPSAMPQTESAMQAGETISPNFPVSLPMVVSEEREESGLRYLVIEQSGDVCVFILDEEGERRFSHKLAIETEALREADQNLFKEGIVLQSKQELLELMEDFSS
ncbi:MAG: hypothetical protein E7393_06630 [Ruminococcaceae bacterium]|nr:hypothetical protein [Oscillospiraceae bacterium]